MNLNRNELAFLQEKTGLARASFNEGDVKQGKEHLQQARLMLPCCAAVEIAIAEVFEQYGFLILSHAYYLEALYRNPGNTRALQGLKDVEFKLQEEKQSQTANHVVRTTLFSEFE